MTVVDDVPRILIIDDLLGRTHGDRRNEERANFCGQLLVRDVTDEGASGELVQRIRMPVAQAVFCRGQQPVCSTFGDTVENDLEGVLSTIAEGWKSGAGGARWAIVLLDLCFYTGRVTRESNARTRGLPEGRPSDGEPEHYFGLRLLEAINERFPDLPVVILSSKPRHEVSQRFSRYGALGFLSRADERSSDLLADYIQRHGLIPDSGRELAGRSKPLLMALRSARRAAMGQRSILIRGERGTGKELLARYVHRQSAGQEDRPLVIVDSGALSPHLYASELFGHLRGAFTGASRNRVGRIVQATNGDLFLDEIGNMPPDVQMGLLRVLEQRVVTPVGAIEGQFVDVRFLSATNEDVEGKAAVGGFRQDLLDRLREGGMIFLPPLRERLEDLEALVERFVLEAERARPEVLARHVEAEAIASLRAWSWPGNVRELRNCIFNAVFRNPDVEHLVPIHLDIHPPRENKETQRLHVGEERTQPGSSSVTPSRLAEVVRVLGELEASHLDLTDLASALPAFQQAYGRAVAQLLKASLSATSRPTPDCPDGGVFIHPAIKLLMGDNKISASKAADAVKRILRVSPALLESLLKDAKLNEAYETAMRLRPRKPRGKATDRT